MSKVFDAIKRDARRLGVTHPELLRLAGVTPSRYSRARRGLTSEDAQVLVLRQLRQEIDRIEREQSACALCQRSLRDPAVRGCLTFGCPLGGGR